MPSAVLEISTQQETAVPENIRASTDVEEESSDDDEQPRKAAKRSQSLDSAERKIKNKTPVYFKSNTLSTEQEKTVEAATESLTAEQREQIADRQKKVAMQHETIESGPSRNKGKTIDPREWGNIRLNPEELSVNVQAALFDAYKEGQKQAREILQHYEDKKLFEQEGNFRIPSVARHKSLAPQDLATRRAGSRPAAQIVPDSSLGVALGKLAKRADEPSDPDDDPDGPDDTSSGYDSDYSRSAKSRSSSRSKRRRHRKSKKRLKRRSRHRERSTRNGTSIKPIAPKDYDGAADARAYHHFVMEGEAYLRDGKVS
jgi:hypothetical protein